MKCRSKVVNEICALGTHSACCCSGEGQAGRMMEIESLQLSMAETYSRVSQMAKRREQLEVEWKDLHKDASALTLMSTEMVERAPVDGQPDLRSALVCRCACATFSVVDGRAKQKICQLSQPCLERIRMYPPPSKGFHNFVSQVLPAVEI